MLSAYPVYDRGAGENLKPRQMHAMAKERRMRFALDIDSLTL